MSLLIKFGIENQRFHIEIIILIAVRLLCGKTRIKLTTNDSAARKQ